MALEAGREMTCRIRIWRFYLEEVTFVCTTPRTRRSDAALEARRRLRHEPVVVEWLARFFDTFVSSRDPDGDAAQLGEFIDREELLAVQVKMCKALFAPCDWDFPEAAEAAEADWAREVGA